MLDIGMLVYMGLLSLAIWRYFCSYWCCGLWLSILNYVALLYLLLAAALVYLLIGFYQGAQQPLDITEYPESVHFWSVTWLKPFVLLAPLAVCATVALNWLHTESHVFEIHKRLAMGKHDRVVQIVALPTVFGIMALASMLPVFELMTGRINADMLASPWTDFKNPMGVHPNLAMLHGTNVSDLHGPAGTAAHPPSWQEAKGLALWRYETCFYVADLFEAWALFQFGSLVLGLVGESISQPENHAEGEEERTLSKLERDLVDSHSAVTSLTWLGTSLFVVLCIAQSTCSVWPYMGGSRESQESIMFHLRIAGFVGSCAAIYNLIIVERAFHRHLEAFSPMLKFLTVKLLISLSFLQRGMLGVLQNLNEMLPHTMQKVVRYVPVLGDILTLSELQLHLFYPALIIFECLFLALLHLFVWRADESWYHLSADEREPLLAKP